MQLTLKDNLPFTLVQLKYNGIVIDIPNVLVDTGSSSTLFSIDALIPLGITPDLTDMLTPSAELVVQKSYSDGKLNIFRSVNVDWRTSI